MTEYPTDAKVLILLSDDEWDNLLIKLQSMRLEKPRPLIKVPDIEKVAKPKHRGQLVRMMLKAGRAETEIARELGVSRQYVNAIKHERKGGPTINEYKRARNEEIKQDHGAGATYADLADKYNLTTERICQIVRGH